MKTNKLGIIGGMGPLATVDFYERIVKHTKACKDQDHIDMIIFNHASMIDRTYAITHDKKEELISSLKEDIKSLENLGVSHIAIPCNTCHTILDELIHFSNIPIINMVEETMKELKKNKIFKIGLMATTGTVSSGIYERYAKEYGENLWIPDSDTQEEIMSIIYNEVKSKGIYDEKHFKQVLKIFQEHGCSKVILGCTELSGFKTFFQDVSIDPMDYLVKACIIASGGDYIETI